jgi:hypothetical protein
MLVCIVAGHSLHAHHMPAVLIIYGEVPKEIFVHCPSRPRGALPIVTQQNSVTHNIV